MNQSIEFDLFAFIEKLKKKFKLFEKKIQFHPFLFSLSFHIDYCAMKWIMMHQWVSNIVVQWRWKENPIQWNVGCYHEKPTKFSRQSIRNTARRLYSPRQNIWFNILRILVKWVRMTKTITSTMENSKQNIESGIFGKWDKNN